MIYLIIGHRGTGKSEWLKVISDIHKENKEDVLCFDLDKEVESYSKKSIDELFKIDSALFREWEHKTFLKIIQSIPKKIKVFISAGAGFEFKKDNNINIIHLRRLTDETERIFFDRPSLDLKQNSMEEFHFFYNKRNEVYLKNKDEIFYRMEHFKEPHLSDYLFFNLKTLSVPLFSIRVCTRDLLQKNFDTFLKKRLNWGVRFFEIHDSDFSEALIHQMLKIIPKEKILFSSQYNDKFKSIENKINWSWDLKQGEPLKGVTILSLHDRGQKSLSEILKYFSCFKNYHLKLAIEIFNFKELWEAYLWYKEDPRNRSFLPRSPNGMWKWFRNAFGSEMFLNFIHEGESEIKDQPLFCEAVHYKDKSKKQAGVLGFPISFSKTPREHHSFFHEERDIPVLSIPMKEGQMTQENMHILKELGFIFFAVTSPLKQKALRCSDHIDKEAENLKSVNTLILNGDQWHGYNTDVIGLKELSFYQNQKIAVWGGGGIRSSLKKHLPEAVFYSARTGKPREDENQLHSKSFSPDIVIWAVGTYHMSQGCDFPPPHWRPSQIIDLNYMENSPGREYTKRVKASYKSGEFLFKKQAQQQRELYLEWERK